MHGRALLLATVALLVLPAQAAAAERLLTLYSPAIGTAPYVHDTHNLVLRPDGRQAPARPGYITGVKEQVLVAPHTVTVANGPLGFSSLYSGLVRGTYTFTPRRRGTYRLTCLIHPTTMGQTLVVR